MRRNSQTATVAEAQARHEVEAALQGQEYPAVLNPAAPVFDPTAEQNAGAMRFVEEGQLPDLVGLDSPEALKALSSVALEGQSPKEWLAEIKGVKAELDRMPQVTVMLPQSAPGKKPLPPAVVQINDYTLQIPRGKPVTVAQEVARILMDGGYLYAQQG